MRLQVENTASLQLDGDYFKTWLRADQLRVFQQHLQQFIWFPLHNSAAFWIAMSRSLQLL